MRTTQLQPWIRASRPHMVAGAVAFTASLLAAACAGDGMPGTAAGRLREAFPEQATEILGDLEASGRGEAPIDVSDGYHLAARIAGEARPEALAAVFPKDARRPVRFSGPSGGTIEVREVGAHGEAELAGAAVAYARSGGTSFWARTASGFEEWLLLGAGIACPGEEAAAWEVLGGASVRQRGQEVEVEVAAGSRPLRPLLKIRVTAPKAFAAGGREVPVRLSVVGRRISIEVDAGCEAALVDPAWELIKPMLAARSEHATVRLGDAANEVVLVIGGTLPNGLVTDGVEGYDPKTDIWSACASLVNGRARHTATVLNDGKVLVAGGIAGGPVPWVEIYDPVINLWGGAPSMNFGRYSHAAARLNDGRVLVTGGIGIGGGPLKTAEIFDPATNTWTNVASMEASRFLHTATPLLDGRVLVWGAAGSAGFPTLNTPFEIFDPAAGTWTTGDFLEATRQRHTATLLSDGRVLIAGGEINGVPLASAQIFDPLTSSRDFITPMLEARSAPTATLLENDNVLVAGGYRLDGASFTTLASTELYYVGNNRWSYSASLNEARHTHTATALHDTRVVIAGGKGGPTLNSAEIYGTALGDPCADVKDCPSGFCVDGVCCDAACDLGQCDACSLASGASQSGSCEILSGAPCDDGLACTVDATCDPSGACQPGAPVVCEASDGCHEGACNPATDACDQTPKADGAVCPVGVCKGGVCVELPDAGTGGGGAGGAGGSGGEPIVWEPFIIQGGGCDCDVAGGSSKSRLGWLALGVIGALRLRRRSRSEERRA